MLKSRHFARRAVAVLGLVVAVSAVVAAAGSASRQAGSVRFYSHTGQQPAYNIMLKNFQKAYPDITVNASYGPAGAGYGPTLVTMVQAGNIPDVFYGNGGSGALESILPLAKAGKLLDLSKQPWVKRMPKESSQLYTVGKKTYGLQTTVSPNGLLYNATEFQRLGLKVPTTYAQLKALCGKAAAAGKIPIAFPGAGAFSQMQALAVSLGIDTAWNTKRLNNKVTFAGTLAWQQVFSRIQDMKDSGCFQPSPQATNVPQALQLVASGKALIIPAPSAAFATVQTLAPTTTFSMVPWPSNTGKGKAMIAYSDGLAVSATAPDKTAALTFVNFLAREGQSRLLAKLLGGVSLHDMRVGNMPTTMTSFKPYFKNGKVVSRMSDEWPGSAPQTALATATSAFLSGQKTAAQALQSIDDAWPK